MAKKIVLALALSVLAAGVVFSQTEETEQTEQTEQTEWIGQTEQAKQTNQTDFKEMAKNTITVDIGPTIVGLAIGIAGNILGGDDGPSFSGFGIGAQYERQLAQKFSAAVRFAYLMGGVGYSYNDSYVDATSAAPMMITVPYKANIGLNISSFSIEGHGRYYPWGKTFFLDGMLGYANMTANSSYKIKGKELNSGVGIDESVNIEASQGFFKLGAKIGWRISFGKNGGFTFEPSLGYVFGIGSGDSVWKQLSGQLSKEINDKNPNVGEIETGDFSEFGTIFGYLQDFVFIGGPRMTLSFGWRF